MGGRDTNFEDLMLLNQNMAKTNKKLLDLYFNIVSVGTFIVLRIAASLFDNFETNLKLFLFGVRMFKFR